MPPKQTLAQLYAEMATANQPQAESPESASEAEPSVDGRLEPAAPQEGQSGAQATPSRSRPIHPYWQGTEITERALREVHLWPRTKPAPQAVIDATQRWWPSILRGSKAAFEASGVAASVQHMVDAMAAAYRRLGNGGTPPRAMWTDPEAEDLAPGDRDRIRYDAALLVIVKCQFALHQAYRRGGAWRDAVTSVRCASRETQAAPEGAGSPS